MHAFDLSAGEGDLQGWEKREDSKAGRRSPSAFPCVPAVDNHFLGDCLYAPMIDM